MFPFTGQKIHSHYPLVRSEPHPGPLSSNRSSPEWWLLALDHSSIDQIQNGCSEIWSTSGNPLDSSPYQPAHTSRTHSPPHHDRRPSALSTALSKSRNCYFGVFDRTELDHRILFLKNLEVLETGEAAGGLFLGSLARRDFFHTEFRINMSPVSGKDTIASIQVLYYGEGSIIHGISGDHFRSKILSCYEGRVMGVGSMQFGQVDAGARKPARLFPCCWIHISGLPVI